METIYNLQKRARVLGGKTQVDSIAPEEVGGLHFDTLAYMAGMERNLSGLGILKTYPGKDEMHADTAPVGNHGKPFRFGQLAAVYDNLAPETAENGCVYAWQNPGWLQVGRIGHYESLVYVDNLDMGLEADMPGEDWAAVYASIENGFYKVVSEDTDVGRIIGTMMVFKDGFGTTLSQVFYTNCIMDGDNSFAGYDENLHVYHRVCHTITKRWDGWKDTCLYRWLGDVADDVMLNSLLDGFHASGEDGKAKAGFFRGDYEGSPFMVESIPINYTEDTWVQSVRGRFVPVYQGTVDKIKTLTRSNTEYNILWRVCEKGTWGTWNSMTDAPTIPDTDLSMGLKDGDVSSAYIQMFTRKGGCYSVTGSRTGVVTGTMMVFCDSWGEHGIEQVLFTDASDIEGKIVHDISSSGHVDGEPRIYHRYYDIRQSGGKWGVWKSFTTGGGTTAPPYVAFDFGVLQEKIGSGRTQSDLDAFGLTEDVWAKIRGAEIMVVRDDANERTYIVSGSSDDYISFSFGLYASDDYEGYTIRNEGDTYTIIRYRYQSGEGGQIIIQ